MSSAVSGPIPYRVVYSQRVRQRLLALADVARERGDGEAFVAALKEFHRRRSGSAAPDSPTLLGYEKEVRDLADLSGELIRRSGMLYFADVHADVRSRLEPLPPLARKAFALACAERLMRRHEALPNPRPFTVGWRPLLDAMWSELADLSKDAAYRVRHALQVFRVSPLNHCRGQDGPDDADEDAAAASIYAAECFLSGDASYAAWAASRATDAAFVAAAGDLQQSSPKSVSEAAVVFASEAMHPTVQGELRTQLADLSLLERAGVTLAVLRSLNGTA